MWRHSNRLSGSRNLGENNRVTSPPLDPKLSPVSMWRHHTGSDESATDKDMKTIEMAPPSYMHRSHVHTWLENWCPNFRHPVARNGLQLGLNLHILSFHRRKRPRWILSYLYAFQTLVPLVQPATDIHLAWLVILQLSEYKRWKRCRLSLKKKETPLDSGTRTTTSTRFDFKCFRVLSKCRLPGKLHFTNFTRKVSIVIFSEGGYALSRSQNDKTFKIWYLVFVNMTFARKLVVEWPRLPRFPAKMKLAHARTVLSIEKISYS